MATYFVSDIHGEYELFLKLLDQINFNDDDTLFVLGDFLDKGKDSIKLVKFLMSRLNIKLIIGNHEFFFISFYQSLMRDYDGNDNIDIVLKRLQEYFPGETEQITWEIVDFIENLPLYIETDSFICVHACVELDKNGIMIPIDRQNSNMLVFDRTFANENKVPRNSKTILFGHTPCNYKNGKGRMIKTPHTTGNDNSKKMEDFAKIQLDNGVAYTKMLGALCLESMEEFYEKEENYRHVK